MLCSSYSPICRALTVAVAGLMLALPVSHAQLPAPPATTEDALRQMLEQAGVVFAGKVTAVRHIAAANGSTGAIEIDFAVEDAVLGVSPGRIYTLREWAGLSRSGDSPFLIGLHYLMFLHAPGASGFSSPVGGPDGAIPVLPANDAASPGTPDVLGLVEQNLPAQSDPATGILPPIVHTNFRAFPAETPSGAAADGTLAPVTLACSTIDLRWIAARVLTPVSYAPNTGGPVAVQPIVLHDHLMAGIAESRAATAEAADANHAATASQLATTGAGYTALLATLRSWQEEDRAAR